MKKIVLVMMFLVLNAFAAGQAGDKATSFTLPNLYTPQTTTSLEKYKGKVVLLNLWASWCSGCQEEMPFFVELQKKLAGHGFYIVTSSIDSDPQNAISFLKSVDKEANLQAIYDKDKSLPKAYKCIGMPSSYLIDQNGVIVKVFVGSLNKEKIEVLKKKIHSLLDK